MGVQNTIEEAGHTLVVLADLIPYHTLTNAEAYLRVAIEIAKRLDLDAAIVPVGCLTANMSGDKIDHGACINTLTTYKPTPLAKGNGPANSIVVQVTKA